MGKLLPVTRLGSAMGMKAPFGCIFVVVCLIGLTLCSYPEQGKWDVSLNRTTAIWGIHKSLFGGSNVFLKVTCSHEHLDPDLQINIQWAIRKSPCWEEYAMYDLKPLEERQAMWRFYLEGPSAVPPGMPYNETYAADGKERKTCEPAITLEPYKQHAIQKDPNVKSSGVAKIPLDPDDAAAAQKAVIKKGVQPLIQVPEDGIYLFVVAAVPETGESENEFTMNFTIEIKTDDGYLSAADFPLLHFYGVMCGLYFTISFIYVILCAMHWRDILRLQLWVSAVSLMGLVEMSFFYAEYQNINSTGASVPGAVLFAEIISCGKRTLARLLVVIVSLGFGIVKPRLGETMHRLVFVGIIYFVLASTESALRILHPATDPQNRALMANLALSLLDASICWWIFHSLVTTTRTLRLRRNLVKLNLYRHFTNTLIFAVIVSLGFMLWSIKYLKMTACLLAWQDKWVDDAFWQALFSVILVIIMILWRPTNNNQRYSFSPLLDATDDEDEDLVVNEAFGNVKLRQKRSPSERTARSRNADLEEELRWVEENIPNDFGDGDLTALDSEEELLNSKFELSKMQ